MSDIPLLPAPGKYKFKPYGQYAEESPESLEKLNSIRSLYYGYLDSEFPVEEIACEFYRAVGKVLICTKLEDLNLKYLEFEG